MIRKMALLTIMLGSFLVMTQGTASAAVIEVSPTTQDVTAGNSVTIDIAISGLGDGIAPSVGAFDLDVAFDPSILSFDSVAFGNQLDLFGGDSITGTDSSVSGIVNLLEVSLDSVSDLNTLQLPTFNLATLTFNTIAAGTSVLSLALNSLGDANGDALAATTQNGSINVTAVPEPASWMLLIFGLIIMSGIQRYSRSREIYA